MADDSARAGTEIEDFEITHLEDLSRRAWPALEVDEIDGWVLASSGAYTRRANSVWPLAADRLTLDARLEKVERFYAKRGRPVVFKLQRAAQPPELDGFLEARGYARTSETVVMTRPSDSIAGASTRTVESAGAETTRVEIVEGRIDADWFDRSVAISGISRDRSADYRAILDKLLTTTTVSLFGRLEHDGQIASLAIGCVVADTVAFVEVATAPEARGRRFAEHMLRGLFGAASPHGARFGLLSVEAENRSARRLYGRLGFVERYRYWYREQPAMRR